LSGPEFKPHQGPHACEVAETLNGGKRPCSCSRTVPHYQLLVASEAPRSPHSPPALVQLRRDPAIFQTSLKIKI
jgi:hypothetical protein